MIFEMFSYPFMVRAFICGILIAVCAAILGVSLVLKRYSMIGDGLSHVGFGALAFRYACFSTASLTGCHALDFGGILIHGLIFGAIVMNVQMHVAEKAPDEIKNQAQGLVMILTSGVGDFLSIAVFYPILVSTCGANGLHNWSVPFLVSFGIAVLAMVLLAVFYRERREAQPG